jgi:hypothetical protein
MRSIFARVAGAHAVFSAGVRQLFEAMRPPCPTFRPRWSWSRTAPYAYNALGIALLQRAAFTDAAGAFRDAIGRAPHWVYPITTWD